MTDKSVHDATEEWVRHSITKEFTPIDINDVYKAFAAGAQWQSQQAQGEAAVNPEPWKDGWTEWWEGSDGWTHVKTNVLNRRLRTHPSAPAPVPEGQAIGLLARVQDWWQNTDGDMPASLEQDIANLLTASPCPPAKAQVPEFDKKLFDSECRESVAGALGFQRGGDYAWSYLLAQIKEAVAAAAMLTASPNLDHSDENQQKEAER